MCGIFGLIVNEKALCLPQTYEESLKLLFRLAEFRGREASGLALAGGEDISIFKRPFTPSVMLSSQEFQEYLGDYMRDRCDTTGGVITKAIAGIGHSRLVTNGSQSEQGNNQPAIGGNIAGVHNGIVANVDDIVANNDDITQESELDSEVLFKLINRNIDENGANVARAVADSFVDLEGAASIAFYRKDYDTLTLATNTGSLYYAGDVDQGWFVFASERHFVERFLKEAPAANMRVGTVRQLKPATLAIIHFSSLAITPVSFADIDNVVEEDHVHSHKCSGHIHDNSLNDIEYKRCTRCILPHTYPFIEFDEEGVCNYCNHFEKQKFLGKEALNRRLEPYRSSTGAPDCILALSGGRDSCYGLHYLAEEMEMHPIAYTYDWGLVTDLARRNQARMCGKLGIEHIVRADDIPTKRRYIRRNIEAWCKRPNLGMVPIFMAGDKMFFHWAREVRKETGIETVIFCSGNELERCEFKVGFTGINDLAVTEVLYQYPLWNKVRMALWYAKEYALNPAYFNESFRDSLFSFYSTFVAKEDFIHLYHYIPWDEKVIDKTLLEDYNWEKGSESDNTWRVGDGYTSFINLIYYSVAGFSEYDTFRSNQIRAGILTREQGLKMAMNDNVPKMEALEEFARVIGFNLDEVLIKIDAIPKLR
ncbi:MAG: hypothetical protein HWE34_06090 [Methylocystaceae bacterium]|nr:hypothetical protein [Methylocystaceae bacterium]